MTLSKSEYMMFLKQPAWLWLKKHDKSKLPEINPALEQFEELEVSLTGKTKKI